MTVYLIRHGPDDNSIRGGWSNHPLTKEGVAQSERLAQKLLGLPCDAERIVASDLLRARQTAEILAQRLNLAIEYTSDFREVNNGCLAGMDQKLAEERYPGLYWKNLAWDQCYPNGESPRAFYERVKGAWDHLIRTTHGSMILVTHGGVINVVLHLVKGVPYSNKNTAFRIGAAEYIAVNIE